MASDDTTDDDYYPGGSDDDDSVSVETQHQPTVSSSEIRSIEQQTRDLNGSYYHQYDNGEFYYAACFC